ncbi:hypothetical protein DB42_BL00620 [Neochlamydia sp. EPS4]|nr:hypothetical protein DB42_BL00620 [Neochlamydia sp. EPS4]
MVTHLSAKKDLKYMVDCSNRQEDVIKRGNIALKPSMQVN